MKWLKRELLYLIRYAGRYSVRRLLRRIFNLFLCCVLVVNVTLVSYADVSEPESGEAASASDEEPEIMMMSVTGISISAFVALLCAIFGVSVAREDLENIAAGFGNFLATSASSLADAAREQWEAVKTTAIVGTFACGALLKLFQEYIMGWEGYADEAAETPSYKVPVTNGNYLTLKPWATSFDLSTSSWSSFTALAFSSAIGPYSAGNYLYYDYYFNQIPNYGYIYGSNDSPDYYTIRCDYNISSVNDKVILIVEPNGDSYTAYTGTSTTNFRIRSDLVSYIPFPIFDKHANALNYINSGYQISDGLLNPSAVQVIPSVVVPKVQTSYKAAEIEVGETITIPETDDAAYAVSDNLVATMTVEEFKAVLADVVSISTVIDVPVDPPAEGEEEEEQSYPWMPDISKLFGGISDQLTELGDWISSIPDALAGIRDNIRAIPGQITDFFTIDKAPIAAAFDSLQAAFASRFPVLQQLGSIFEYQGVSFDQSAPVFKMQVPEPLKFAYPDTDEIVILDLTPYATYFQSVRMLLVAIFWLLFARWLLQEFDIKFHIG